MQGWMKSAWERLQGPVIAAAVMLALGKIVKGLDAKLLSAKRQFLGTKQPSTAQDPLFARFCARIPTDGKILKVTT
jgi:hypothetical protein